MRQAGQIADIDKMDDAEDDKKWERHLTSFKKWSLDNGCAKIGESQIAPNEVQEAARTTREWRQEVRQLFDALDRAQRHVAEFRSVYNQVRDMSGYHTIYSGFERVINRRYQPSNFWPTYVTSKSTVLPEEEIESYSLSEDDLGDYRRRWFKARHIDTGIPCDLVGKDISSSQTQIIATLLGAEKLENITMASSVKSFKKKMAEWA